MRNTYTRTQYQTVANIYVFIHVYSELEYKIFEKS